MENRETNVGELRMLPHVWKKIGIVVAAASVVAMFVAIFAFRDKTLARYCVSLFIVGLYVAAISKDKREDEMLAQMRLIAFGSGFGFGVLLVAITPLTSSIFSFYNGSTAESLVISMLCFYHFSFYMTKLRVRREKHD